MGTKNNPAPNDCYEKAGNDEPMFTLLARDPDAALLVRFWAELRKRKRVLKDQKKIAEALNCATEMEAWRDRRENEPYITVSSGMGGFFAVLLQWSPDIRNYEPYQSGEHFATRAEAVVDGEHWAIAEELEFKG